MGSKIKVIDTQDKRFNRFGYVCDWKHGNDSGVTAVKVEMVPYDLDVPEYYEIVWFNDSQIQEVE